MIGEVKFLNDYKGNNEIKVGEVSVLFGMLFLLDSVKIDYFRKFIKVILSDFEFKFSKKFEMKLLVIVLIFIFERFDDILGKL